MGPIEKESPGANRGNSTLFSTGTLAQDSDLRNHQGRHKPNKIASPHTLRNRRWKDGANE